MGIKSTMAFTGLAIAITGAPATAATFSYNATDIDVKNENAGKFKHISTTYDDESDLFSWSSTFSRAPKGTLAEAAWLVVNNGPNPRKNSTENVIFYMDGIKGQVSAYNYNGKKGAKSYLSSDLIATTHLDVDDSGDERTLSFNLDMTDINGMTDKYGSDWQGTSFDEKIGIWFHGLDNTSIDYDKNGRLTDFSFKGRSRSVLDIADEHTNGSESVPEPGTAAAIGMTVAAAAFTKLRKRSATA